MKAGDFYSEVLCRGASDVSIDRRCRGSVFAPMLSSQPHIWSSPAGSVTLLRPSCGPALETQTLITSLFTPSCTMGTCFQALTSAFSI
ncbi:hypothetical protein D4764_08G0007050 [Takifugu flavidus]|uniref:Uncharacterized protein n=1 Tax=Takifugu flavidus TaxID=433684 RepID=A0A5C6MQV0_9TELE|nr:hypothetical protein D4764_08G0007050 [Takifugu flavidus]